MEIQVLKINLPISTGVHQVEAPSNMKPIFATSLGNNISLLYQVEVGAVLELQDFLVLKNEEIFELPLNKNIAYMGSGGIGANIYHVFLYKQIN